MIQQERPNGNNSYYDFSGNNHQHHPARTDSTNNMMSRDTITYGRSTGEILASQLTTQLTPGTNTPAMVAQALSGLFYERFQLISRQRWKCHPTLKGVVHK